MEKQSNDNEDVLVRAKERFSNALEVESENLRLADEDMQFRAGEQWPEEIKRQRERDNKPCLTINRIPQNIHQITNDQRQNRPSIRINPFDDYADVETAKILQGLIRNIENNSHADVAYDVAADHAVTGGRGHFRIKTDYCDHMTFDQDIKICAIFDQNGAILDPSHKQPDGSDASFGFVYEDISKDEFRAQWPDSKMCEAGFDWGDVDALWSDKNTVRIAEYFEKTYKKDTLYLLEDGSTVLKSDIKKNKETVNALMEQAGIEDLDSYLKNLESRETQVPIVMWYKMNGEEVLEKTEWPSKYIPIIPVYGEVLYVKGKKVTEGIVRHAKDPQRMYNYWATCETETIALAPKAPFIGAEGQFEGHEAKWNTANVKNWTFLEYKPTLLDNGQMAPPPQRQYGEANTQHITQARMLASDDLKATTGIYDAALGNQSNEQSGVAIRSRSMQSQTGNFHFIDNLSRSIAHAGRIIVELIPVIYDTERAVRVIGTEDEQELVHLNKVFTDEKGEKKKYDVSLGKYDVVVDVGPSYATKRQEAVASMLDLSRSNPQLTAVAGDLMVKNMDWPLANEISERIKKTIDPKILGENEGEVPPEIQAQMDEMNMIIEQMTAQLDDARYKLDNKTLELESKERIEFAKLENDLRIKSAELSVKESANPNQISILLQEIAQINERMELLKIDSPISQDEIAEQLENEIQNNNLPGGVAPENTGHAPMGEI